MTKFEQVLQSVTETILGVQEEVKTPTKPTVGFSTEKPKRKYTRRKKTTTKRKAKK
tara:strand:+ start:234 stop:401 length:168 start_codon:yes stop_codon:yes gene_type:complete